MVLFPFDEGSRRDTKILHDFLSGILLMTVGLYHLLLKLWAIGPPFPIDGKSRVAISAKESLGLISSASILFGLGAVALDAVSHGS